jgi:transposase InsO family protein
VTEQQRRCVRRKLKILADLERLGNVSRLCRHYGISRQSYYIWKREYEAEGEEGLINNKPCPENPRLRIAAPIQEKIFHLQKNYHFGPVRMSWYLLRYHGLKVSQGGIRKVLERNGMNRLPTNNKVRRAGTDFKRYEKQLPGHHVQVDAKFLFFKNKSGKRIKRFQFTAIDDATRLRVLKVYEKHTQASAIDFVEHVVKRFPFRIRSIRTDNGHEFQAKFHWHVNDLGIDHVYIKKASPHLNGKVERSHRTDEEEFYRFLKYKDDSDLGQKMEAWERFYNRDRPHGAHKGKTPIEVLNERLQG